MASAFYPKVFKKFLDGDLDIGVGGADASNVKLMLLGGTASYAYDVTHEFASTPAAAELSTSGTGYSRKTIPVSLAFNADVAGSGAAAGCDITLTLTDNAKWENATFTTAHAVVFIDKGGADSANPLLYYFDLTADQIVSSGTFELRNPTNPPRIRRA